VTQAIYTARVKPVVMIRVNGEPRPDLEERRIVFQYNDRVGKRDTAELVLADPGREISNGDLLQPDDIFEVTWGYPDNMSKVRTLRLKGWTPNYDEAFPTVKANLMVTSARQKLQGKRRVTEPHTTQKPKNWGKRESSDIAKRIARRHGLKFKGDASDDIDVPFYQPGNVSDYEFLQQLADDIDFECFIEGDTLYYRAKPYDERPRRVFYYYPQGGGLTDTLLLSFTPEVKVIKVSVKPRGSNTSTGDANVKLEATLSGINAEFSELAGTNAANAQTASNNAQQSAAADLTASLEASANFKLNPNASTAQQAAQSRAAVEDGLAALKNARADLRSSKTQTGKAAYAEQTTQINSQAQGDKGSCAGSSPSKAGDTPTGEPSTQEAVVLGLGDSRDLTYLPASNAQSLATPSVSERKRQREACASFAKMKDRAVTASAEFVGDPALRSKVNYEVRGVGRRFEGSWYSKDTTHTVGDNYRVQMKLKKGTIRKIKKGKGTSANAMDPNAANQQTSEVLVLGLANERVSRIETRSGVPNT